MLGAKRENDFCNKIRRSEVIVYSRHIRSISRKFFHPIWGLIYLKKIYLKEGRTLALALAISKYTKSDKPSHHFTWWWGEWLSVHQQCRDAQWTIFTKKQFTAKFSPTGQIISKELLVSSNSPKKRTNEFVVVVKTNLFVRFLGEFEDTKSPFEIIWPLGKTDFQILANQLQVHVLF